MPVITGSRGGGSTSPYLTLQWDVIETDVANNRSKVRLILKLVADYNLQFSASKSGKLQGSSFTYTTNVSGTGSWTLKTSEVWVGHNSDGSKTQNFNGSLNLSVTFSGTWIGNMSVSGNVTLPAIPRQSLLNSASMTNLKNGSASTLSIGRTVYHNGFYHIVSIFDGNTWIWDSGYFSGAPDTTYPIPSDKVNYMLGRMSTSTSKTFTVRLRTYTSSGGNGLIGTQSRNMSVGVDSTVKPTVSGLSISQEGNSVSSHYLQTISRVKAEFSASAGYGATISTRTIIVRKVGGSNAQTISGASGTTTNPIASTGSYEVVATARDSRGRTSDVLRTTFTATAYNQPTIGTFLVTRQADAQAVVDISRSGSWTSLGGLNILTISIERRQGSGTWGSVENTTGTSGSFTRDFTNPSNSVSLSYDYRLVISDKFGNSAESMASITTQRVVLDIHKNEGVGIGKIHERGVLDVDGEVYLNGKVMAIGGLGFEDTRTINEQPNQIPPRAFSFAFKTASYIAWPPERANTTYAHILNISGWNGEEGSGGYPMQMSIGGQGISLRQGTSPTAWSGWSSLVSTESGTNTNGRWIKFGDGTLICYATVTAGTGTWSQTDQWGFGGFYSSNNTFTTPHAFIGTDAVVTANAQDGGYRSPWVRIANMETASKVKLGLSQVKGSTASLPVTYQIIGRWK